MLQISLDDFISTADSTIQTLKTNLQAYYGTWEIDKIIELKQLQQLSANLDNFHVIEESDVNTFYTKFSQWCQQLYYYISADTPPDPLPTECSDFLKACFLSPATLNYDPLKILCDTTLHFYIQTGVQRANKTLYQDFELKFSTMSSAVTACANNLAAISVDLDNYYPHIAKLNDIEISFDALNFDVGSIRTTLNAMQSNFASLNTYMQSINSKFQILQEQYAVEGPDMLLATQSISTQITSISASASDIYLILGAINTAIRNVQTEIADIEATLKSGDGSQSVFSALAEISANITLLEINIGNINTALAGIGVSAIGIHEGVDSLAETAEMAPPPNVNIHLTTSNSESISSMEVATP